MFEMMRTVDGAMVAVTDDEAVAEAIRSYCHELDIPHRVFFTGAPDANCAKGLALGATALFDRPFRFGPREGGGWSARPVEER